MDIRPEPGRDRVCKPILPDAGLKSKPPCCGRRAPGRQPASASAQPEDARALFHRLSPAEAGAVAKRGRKLLRAGKITHHQLALLDCLLWSCRSPSSGAIVVSYSGLQRLARMGRATVAAGLARLEGLGVLSRFKRRVRVVWGGGTASRQATSAYVLHPAAGTEFAERTVFQRIEIKEDGFGGGAEARLCAVQALAAVRDRRRPVVEGLLLG